MTVPHNMILQQLPEIRDWLSERLPNKPRLTEDECVTFGLVDTRKGKIGGVVGIHRWKPESMTCELSVVIDHPRILSRQVLAYIAGYVFRTLGCRRCETEIDVTNERSWRGVERLGFTREGTKRSAARDGGDVYLYGMLKEECKWLVADQA